MASSSSKQLLTSVAKKYPLRIAASIVLGLSGAVFNGIGTTLIVPVLLSLIGQESSLEGGPPLLEKILSPFDAIAGDYRIQVMTGAIILLIFLKSATNYGSTLVSTTLARRVTSDFQERGINLILDVDVDYFAKMRVGDLMNRLGGEMNRATLAITGAVQLFVAASTVLVFLGILISISPAISIATVLIFPMSLLLNRGLIINSKRFGKQLSLVNNRYSSGLVELIGGMRLVRSTGNEGREHKRFIGLIKERERIDFFAKANTGVIGPMAEFFNIVALFAIVFISRAIFANNLELLGTILPLYMILIFRMLPYISQINTARDVLAMSSSPVEVVNDMLRRDNKSFMPRSNEPYPGLQSDIEFQNLHFGYPGGDDLVLRGIDLTLPKGTTLALVGSSGAGKSTLAELLPRFYDPSGGQIIINDRDLRDYDIASFRRTIGIVSQETFLFNNTVRYNLAYGRPEATDAEINAALRQANAYDFVQDMSEGLDTIVGDRGIMLSGGQRQRLAIARALVQDPEILILDEATSALDTVSERLVQAAIDELSKERTTLVIAHRLSTVRKADQIAVLDKGRVVELGNHDALLEKGGLYSELHNMQAAKQSEETEAVAVAETTAETPEATEVLDKDAIARQAEQAVIDRLKLVPMSYETRSIMTAMIGSLGLLADNLVETEQERHELSRDAYDSALEVLKRLENFEENTLASSSFRQ